MAGYVSVPYRDEWGFLLVDSTEQIQAIESFRPLAR